MPTSPGASAYNKTDAQIGDFVALVKDRKLGRIQNVYQNVGRPYTFDIQYDDGTTTLDCLPHLIDWNPPLPQDQVKASSDPTNVDTFTAWKQDSSRHDVGWDWRCDTTSAKAPSIPRRKIFDSTHTVRPPIAIVARPKQPRRARFHQPPPAPTPIGINQSVTPPSRTGRSFTSYVPPDWLSQHSLRKQLEEKIKLKELEKQRLIDGLPEYQSGPSTPFPDKASTPWQPRRPTLDDLRRQGQGPANEEGLSRAMTATNRAIDSTATKLARFEKMVGNARREMVDLHSRMRRLQEQKVRGKATGTRGRSYSTPGKGIFDDDW